MDLAKYSVWLNANAAYYPVRKAGSSSIQHAFGGTPVDMRLVPNGVLKFTWIRNPFDRLASLFAQNVSYTPLRASGIYKGMSFEEFIDKVCRTREPLCDHHLWGANHTTPHDAEVFYFEDFNQELDRLRQYLDRNLLVRHIGATRRSPKPTYTPELEALVAKRYHKDLERFYENNTTIEGCRAGGKTAARLRQQATTGTGRVHQE
jgi:hypothetical protein